MKYRIDAKLVTPSENFDTRGYNVESFFEGEGLSQKFESKAQAEKWAEQNYLGPDKYGVAVEWSVYGQGPELLKQRFRI